MEASFACKLKLVPVMPGAVACAVAVNSNVSASIATGASLNIEIVLFIFVALIAALLVDPDFSHQSTEVLGIVRQVVEIGGIEIKYLASRVTSGVENHVERLAASQRDGIRVVVQVVSGLIPQEFGIQSDDLHGNPK